MMSTTSKSNRFKVIVTLLVAMMLLISCGTQEQVQNDDPKQPPISSKPVQQKETVKLYFSDDQAMYLQPEVREITLQGEPLAEVVVKELIKGPTKKELVKTVPPATKLLSLQIADGIAYVNLSKEVQTTHWGGSSGERMTVYSIVNTLADLNIGIKKVQILVDGEKQQTLVGHLETFDPIVPDWYLTKIGEIRVGTVQLNMDKLQELQQEVNQGHQPWNLDPMQVAMENSTRYGFDPRVDEFTLIKIEELAYVKATHNGKDYTIQLIQPVVQGEAGVWTISSITQNS